MSYLVHVWLNAAHKERVGGAECGHQGVQRILDQRHNTLMSNRNTVKMTLTLYLQIREAKYDSGRKAQSA